MKAVVRAVLMVAGAAVACAGGPPRPATLDPGDDSCSYCRMVVSDPRFAGQIVARGEDPLFFDDLGCLRDYIHGGRSVPAGAVAYVVDHRTGTWVPGGRAVFTSVPDLSTPMGGGIIAHADRTSRDSDATARGGTSIPPSDVIGATLAGSAP
jgi:copper chaperone NosL